MLLRVLVLLAGLTVGLFGVSVEAGSPTGKWRGSWSSQTTGHSGPMKAHIRQIDSDSYRAVFVGRFAGVVPFMYPATLDRVPGTCDCYRSSQRLPLVGTYNMTAHINARSFNARYHSSRERGTFNMSR
ncbi:MAG: hypothetical protein AAGG48_24925 [Planctomycetota bacterium]